MSDIGVVVVCKIFGLTERSGEINIILDIKSIDLMQPCVTYDFVWCGCNGLGAIGVARLFRAGIENSGYLA